MKELLYDDLNDKQKQVANALGYHGWFASPPREECKERLEYARSIGDTQGIKLSVVLLNNRNAIDKASGMGVV